MINEWFYLCAFLCGDLLKRKGRMSFRDKLLFLQIIVCMGRHLTLHYEEEKQRLMDRIDDETVMLKDKDVEVSEETLQKIIQLVEACRDFKTSNTVIA